MFIRLTTLLCVGLYGGMMIFGTEQSDATAVAVTVLPEPVSARSSFSPSDLPVLIKANFASDVVKVEPVSAAPALAATAPPKDEKLMRVGTYDAPAGVLASSGIEVVEVSGSLVNLRAGPSTSDDVVGKLSRGSRAELVADAGDGWMKIRDLASGTVGFMSEDFLTVVTPG